MTLPPMFTLIVLFLCFLETSTGKKSKENGEKALPSFPWAQSGQFSTSKKHSCTWQLASGDGATEIQLSCHPPGEDSSQGQQCVYRGQPELCPAYNSKGRQFWKQILGKLRKKHHPCKETSPLKSRLCSGKKGGSEAQLNLVVIPFSTEASVTVESTTTVRPKGKGRPKDPPSQQKAPRDRGQGSPGKANTPDKRNKGEKRKGGPNPSAAPTQTPNRQLTAIVGGSEQPTELNADAVEAYCEEKWHSLCNFFVNFWNG